MGIDAKYQKHERAAWVRRVSHLTEVPLSACVDGSIKEMTMARSRPDRAQFGPLEVLGRIFAGVGPWIGRESVSDPAEEAARLRMRDATLAALVAATSDDPERRFNFSRGDQPLVDAALLALGIFRAGAGFWEALDMNDRERVLGALEEARTIKPWHNNWLLFSAVIEAFLASKGQRFKRGYIEHALHCFDKWYLGDGIYADGASVGVDYYNSTTIHPLLLTLVELDGGSFDLVGKRAQGAILQRAQRHAQTLERVVGADGSFPAVGRSITYRCGAFHLLAHLALMNLLPENLPPARIRGCLEAVISWTLDFPGTFDSQGWLQVGLRGHQPDLADRYTSAGSGYFCLAAFLPLGLGVHSSFWCATDEAWSSKRLERGESPGPDKKFGKPTSFLGKVARELQLGRRWFAFTRR